jgi:ADP-heptose:LPS heptosyltransferase
MGDIAMTVPVIKQLLLQYPELTITFISDIKFTALFENIPRLTFYGADIHGKYNGFAGLLHLFAELKKIQNITFVADLHNVLRTKVLSFLFQMAGKKVKRINKGRKEKKALTRKHNKKLVPLPSTFQRYADVFAQLGYTFNLKMPAERIKLPANNDVQNFLGDNNSIKIGIAPFGKHKEKTYPPELMEKVMVHALTKGYKIFLLGGKNEVSQLEKWESRFMNVINIAGKLSFKEELMLISNLNLMVSMDSANMHLASLYAVPVVSIWGATHPYAGFYGFAQDPLNAVIEDIYCRPCSVFGNIPCYRGDWACMYRTSPELVAQKIEYALQLTKKNLNT